MKGRLPGTFTIIAMSLMIALAIAEVLTRLIRPFSTVTYGVDPELGHILVANQGTRWVNEDYDQTVTTNNAGFHDYDHQIEKPSDVYRIVVLGDSFIEALSAPIESGFTQQLEQLIQHDVRSRRVEVINLAVGGTGPAQYLRMLQAQGLAYHPDLVIMAVFPDNDFWDSYEGLSGSSSKVFYRLGSDGSLEYLPPRVSWVSAKSRRWLRKSAFLSLLRTGMNSTAIESWLTGLGVLQAPGLGIEPSLRRSEWGVFLATHPEPWPAAYQTTLESIRFAHRLTADGGAEFLVMVIASVAMVEDRWNEALAPYPEAGHLRWDFEYPSGQIAQLGENDGFPVISLLEPFREDFKATGRSQSWPHDGHWSPAGNRLAAQVCSRYLVAHRDTYGLPD